MSVSGVETNDDEDVEGGTIDLIMAILVSLVLGMIFVCNSVFWKYQTTLGINID